MQPLCAWCYIFTIQTCRVIVLLMAHAQSRITVGKSLKESTQNWSNCYYCYMYFFWITVYWHKYRHFLKKSLFGPHVTPKRIFLLKSHILCSYGAYTFFIYICERVKQFIRLPKCIAVQPRGGQQLQQICNAVLEKVDVPIREFPTVILKRTVG